MLTKEEAKILVEEAYPNRNVNDNPIIHNNEYVFFTSSKTPVEMEPFAGIGRWVNMNTGEISEKNLVEIIATDDSFAEKFAEWAK